MEDQFVAAAVFSTFVLTTLLNWFLTSRKFKNEERLTPANLNLMVLPRDDERLINIFTKSDPAIRVDMAKDLHKEYTENYNRASTRLEGAQEVFDEYLREINSIQVNVNKKKSRGEKDAMFTNRLAPKLTQMKDKLATVSLRLESISMIAPILDFLETVMDGHGRVATTRTYQKQRISSEREVKLKDAMKAANKTLSLGEAEFENAIETWISEY